MASGTEHNAASIGDLAEPAASDEGDADETGPDKPQEVGHPRPADLRPEQTAALHQWMAETGGGGEVDHAGKEAKRGLDELVGGTLRQVDDGPCLAVGDGAARAAEYSSDREEW